MTYNPKQYVTPTHGPQKPYVELPNGKFVSEATPPEPAAAKVIKVHDSWHIDADKLTNELPSLQVRQAGKAIALEFTSPDGWKADHLLEALEDGLLEALRNNPATTEVQRLRAEVK